MLKSRMSYIKKDLLALIIALFFSIVLLFSNKSNQVYHLKFQILTIINKFAYPFSWYENILSVKAQNKVLKHEVLRLTLLNSELIGNKAENAKLKELLNFAKQSALNYLTANVVNHDFGISSQSLIIDIGKLQNLKKDLPVLDEKGLLGKTIYIDNQASMVQLITDKNYRVSIRAGNERVLGIFLPTHGKYGILEGVRKTSVLNEGDIVFTSGISKIYPPNIPVAIVKSTNKISNKPFQEVIVEILASINNLDFVFVIL